MYDRFEQLVFDSQISAAILGNRATRDYVLVVPSPGPLPESLYGRGLEFLGVVGMVGGVPQTEFAAELEPGALFAIAQEWIQHLAGIAGKSQPAQPTQTAQSSQSAVEWCEHLYWLPDTRD